MEGITPKARLLADALAYFGHAGDQSGFSAVPVVGVFAMSHYPNSFILATTINYTVAQLGY